MNPLSSSLDRRRIEKSRGDRVNNRLMKKKKYSIPLLSGGVKKTQVGVIFEALYNSEWYSLIRSNRMPDRYSRSFSQSVSQSEAIHHPVPVHSSVLLLLCSTFMGSRNDRHPDVFCSCLFY